MKQDLDVQVVSALQDGRKVEAIKLLRRQRGIGLKEAKDIVDSYCEEHGLSRSSQASGGTGGLMLVGLVVLVGYLVYRYVLGSAAG